MSPVPDVWTQEPPGQLQHRPRWDTQTDPARTVLRSETPGSHSLSLSVARRFDLCQQSHAHLWLLHPLWLRHQPHTSPPPDMAGKEPEEQTDRRWRAGPALLSPYHSVFPCLFLPKSPSSIPLPTFGSSVQHPMRSLVHPQTALPHIPRHVPHPRHSPLCQAEGARGSTHPCVSTPGQGLSGHSRGSGPWASPPPGPDSAPALTPSLCSLRPDGLGQQPGQGIAWALLPIAVALLFICVQITFHHIT